MLQHIIFLGKPEPPAATTLMIVYRAEWRKDEQGTN